MAFHVQNINSNPGEVPDSQSLTLPPRLSPEQIVYLRGFFLFLGVVLTIGVVVGLCVYGYSTMPYNPNEGAFTLC